MYKSWLDFQRRSANVSRWHILSAASVWLVAYGVVRTMYRAVVEAPKNIGSTHFQGYML